MTTISVMNFTGGKITEEREKARNKRKGRKMTEKAQGLAKSLCLDSSIFLIVIIYSQIVLLVLL